MTTLAKRGNYELGRFGEELVITKLAEFGIDAVLGKPGDVQACGISIEVKTSRPTMLNPCRHDGFQFCVRRFGHTDFDAHFLVLICLSYIKEPLAFFILPASAVHSGNKIVIPTEGYRGKYLTYLERWDYIESACRSDHAATKH